MSEVAEQTADELTETEALKPFSIFKVKPGDFENVNLFVMRLIFKHLAETVFSDLKLPDPVTLNLAPKGLKWDKLYDDKGKYVKRLKINLTVEFSPDEEIK